MYYTGNLDTRQLRLHWCSLQVIENETGEVYIGVTYRHSGHRQGYVLTGNHRHGKGELYTGVRYML